MTRDIHIQKPLTDSFMLQNEQCKLVLGLFPTINYTLIVLREPTKWLLIVNVALSPASEEKAVVLWLKG